MPDKGRGQCILYPTIQDPKMWWLDHKETILTTNNDFPTIYLLNQMKNGISLTI